MNSCKDAEADHPSGLPIRDRSPLPDCAPHRADLPSFNIAERNIHFYVVTVLADVRAAAPLSARKNATEPTLRIPKTTTTPTTME